MIFNHFNNGRRSHEVIFITTIAFLDDPICASGGHKILDDIQRQVSSAYLGPSFFGKVLCDGYIKEDWYRFQINGEPVEAADKCPQVFSCGTKDPVWISMQNRPEVGM